MAATTDRNSKESRQHDADFLREMRERFRKARDKDDRTQFEYVEQMINDWIAELEG